MVNGDKVREALSSILKDCCLCSLDSKSLSGGLCSTWNPIKGLFNAYHSPAIILLEGRFQGWNQVVKVVNCYGPYSNRKDFWNQRREDGLLLDPTVIIGGDLNLTLSSREI